MVPSDFASAYQSYRFWKKAQETTHCGTGVLWSKTCRGLRERVAAVSDQLREHTPITDFPTGSLE
jgi:hypothetical protein